MTRRRFIGAAGAAAATAAGAGAADESRPPNVVFILTDDQRWDSLSALGHPFARTPHMDRLVREGAHFRNAFVTTSLCSPSRAAFLTGQYAHTHGVRDNFGDVRRTTWTFPRAFQQAGYETCFVGKWHMGYDRDDPRPGFDHWVSFKGQGSYNAPELNINGRHRRVEGYTTDLLSEYAARWITEPRKKPFLAVVSHKAVHTPITPAERHEKLFEGARWPLPASFHDAYEGKPAWQRERRKSRTGVDGGLGRYGSLDEFVRRTYRTLASVDDGVGRIFEALAEIGELERTIVVFAGDNGFFHGEHGFLNKRSMYEESIRIPLLVRYPKLIRPGSVVEAAALNIDLAPSLLDMAGVEPPEGMAMQGRSWKPFLGGDNPERARSWLYEYFYEPRFAPTPGMQGVRTDRWKYVRYPDIDDVDELYDLADDPHEMRNLAGAPAARAQRDRMRAELFRLLKQTKAA